jgi:hypothetical protein
MLKNIIQWNYERGTWPYDIFCLLIVAFIFLTPKSWFEKREIDATRTPKAIVKEEAFLPGEYNFTLQGTDSGDGRVFAVETRKTKDFARERYFYAVDRR